MKSQTITTVLGLQRKIYMALTEFVDITAELEKSITGRDQRTVRTFIMQRQDALETIQECRELLFRQIATLPAGEGQELRRILSGEREKETEELKPLYKILMQNDRLFARARAADEAVNRKIGGAKSFYERT